MHNILHFCGMLSSSTDSDVSTDIRHIVPWNGLRVLPRLADMPESDIDGDREEFVSRLGVVLGLARKAAGLTQENAASTLKMSADAIGRWENGQNKISGYDLVRLIRLYDFDPDLAVNPPASKPEIRRRLGPVPTRAQRAIRRGQLRPLQDDGERE